jgi:hypothetical protein
MKKYITLLTLSMVAAFFVGCASTGSDKTRTAHEEKAPAAGAQPGWTLNPTDDSK